MCVRLSKSAHGLKPSPGAFFRLEPKPVVHATLKEATDDLGGRQVGRQGWVLVVQRSGDVLQVEQQPTSLSYAQAEKRAEELMVPDGTVILGTAVRGNQRGTVYKHELTITYDDMVRKLAAGIADLDLMLALSGHPTSIQKASSSDVYPQDKHIEPLTATLSQIAGKSVDLMVEDLVELATITDWVALGQENIGPIISQMAEKMLKSGEAFAGKVQNPLLKEGMRIVKGVRQWDAAKHGWADGGNRIPASGPIKATFDASDKAAVAYLQNSTANFVTDAFRQRSELFSEAARRIVARGFDQGLGPDEIGQDLAKWIQLRGGDPSYYRVVSYAYTVRAEAYGHLSTYKQAGVEAAQVQAVLDEHTTDICRWADGKLVRVGKALDLLKGLEKLEDPQEVKQVNPWVRTRQLEDGKKELYVRGKDDKETVLAEISRSGMGAKDDRGEYTDKVKDILDAGIGPPPFHGLCRSTLVPVII